MEGTEKAHEGCCNTTKFDFLPNGTGDFYNPEPLAASQARNPSTIASLPSTESDPLSKTVVSKTITKTSVVLSSSSIPSLPSASRLASGDHSSASHQTNTVAIGVSVPIGAIVLSAIVFLWFRRYKQRRRTDNKATNQKHSSRSEVDPIHHLAPQELDDTLRNIQELGSRNIYEAGEPRSRT